jgi:membrane protease YdiL (CAAX protease family)
MAADTTQDFPFYRDLPVPVGGRGWFVVMASLAVSFAVITAWPIRYFPLNLVPALLFVAIPLVALRLVVGPYWKSLFRPVGVREVALMVLFAALTLGGSLCAALVLERFSELHHNPVSDAVGLMKPADLALLLIPTAFQLVGEELLGILPFLAALWFCVTRLRLSRRVGIFIGLIVSGLVFGAAHLPTYHWHWAQALVGIGSARVLLTLGYIVTRNLWVSAGAHILNDWTGFLVIAELGHEPIGTDI